MVRILNEDNYQHLLLLPHLRSLGGLSLTMDYVTNWKEVLLVYLGIKKRTTARFVDGKTVSLSKSEIALFYEEIYSRYLKDRGFVYRNQIVIMPDGLKIKMLPPPAIYSFVIDEIFIMNVYGRPQLAGRSVVDIGASIGDTALFFASSCGAEHVYGFEIDPARFELAVENIQLNDLQDRITIINAAATGETVNRLIKEKKLTDVFLKIDCEGCEYELIETLDLSEVCSIALEYHGSKKPLLFRLKDAGFRTIVKGEIILAERVRN